MGFRPKSREPRRNLKRAMLFQICHREARTDHHPGDDNTVQDDLPCAPAWAAKPNLGPSVHGTRFCWRILVEWLRSKSVLRSNARRLQSFKPLL